MPPGQGVSASGRGKGQAVQPQAARLRKDTARVRQRAGMQDVRSFSWPGWERHGSSDSCHPPFYCVAVPLRQRCSGFVGTLEKLQQRLFRRGSRAYVIIVEEEFTQLLTVERRRRANRSRLESRRLWIDIRVESRGRETLIAG